MAVFMALSKAFWIAVLYETFDSDQPRYKCEIMMQKETKTAPCSTANN